MASPLSWIIVWLCLAVPVHAALIGSWACNEGTGTTIADTTSGLTGILTNATWTASGRYGAGLVLNGTNAWVTVPHHTLLNLTTGLTMMAWVYPTALGAGVWREVLVKEHPTTGEVYNLYANTNTNVPSGAIIRSATPSTVDDVRGVTPLPLNAWTHLATTYDNAMLRLYVNGVEVATRPLTGALLTSTAPLRLGGNSLWGEFFQGRLDELRLYSHALTASEIVSAMNTPIQPPMSQPPAPASNPAVQFFGQATLPLTLVWYDQEPIAGRFELERRPLDGAFTLIQTVPGVLGVGQRTTQDATAPQGMISCWRVRQVDEIGGPNAPSVYSNEVCISVQ